MLKKHLATDHDLTPQDYRARWNLPVDYPMVAPDYAQKRRELAVKIGLGRKPKAAAPAPVTPQRGRPKAAPASLFLNRFSTLPSHIYRKNTPAILPLFAFTTSFSTQNPLPFTTH